jgi:hypothetical protein
MPSKVIYAFYFVCVVCDLSTSAFFHCHIDTYFTLHMYYTYLTGGTTLHSPWWMNALTATGLCFSILIRKSGERHQHEH